MAKITARLIYITSKNIYKMVLLRLCCSNPHARIKETVLLFFDCREYCGFLNTLSILNCFENFPIHGAKIKESFIDILAAFGIAKRIGHYN